MGPHEMCPMFLSDFNEAWIFFFERCEKYKQISNFMLIRPVTADLFHADRWTDGQTYRRTYMAKLIVAFRNFCERL